MEKRNVLIVNDSFGSRMLLGDICEDNGFSYIEAKHGQEALDKLMLFLPDLILMDIEMPVMNGIEATRQIKAKELKIPVVATTAHNPQNFKDYKQGLFNAILIKPYSSDDVKSALTKYCKRP